MNPNDKTAPSQSETITFEFELNHTPQKVWRALTDPVLLAEWLLPAVGFELEPDATFTLQAPPQPGWDGVVNCKVIEIELEQTLGLTWRVGELDTVVTFSLRRTDSGTHLTIVQTGFEPGQKQAFGGARYGWAMMGEKLVDLLRRTA